MCIIIVNKAGNFLDSKVLNESCRVNSDGFGLMYSVKNKLHLYKTLDSKLFMERYYKIRKEHENIDIVLHARIGTSGDNNITNCHPFYVNDKLAFCHNGILTDFSLTKNPLSDTQIFNRQMLKKLPKGFIYSKEIRDLLKAFIGHGNKLAFMDHKGKIFIINETAGNTDKNGNWYSNYSYKTYSSGYVYDNYDSCSHRGNKFYNSDLIQWNKKTKDYTVMYIDLNGKLQNEIYPSYFQCNERLKTNALYIDYGKYITWNKGSYEVTFKNDNISTITYFKDYHSALVKVVNTIAKDGELLSQYIKADKDQQETTNVLIPFIDSIDNYCQFCGTELMGTDAKLLQTCPNCFQHNNIPF